MSQDRPADPTPTERLAAARGARRVAVSGAEGFIGRRFLELYGSGFDRAIGLVRRLPDDRVDGVEYRVCDVAFAHAVRFSARDCDAVVHAAYDSRNRPHTVAATENVVAACRQIGARLVHLSTVAVYDQTRDGTLDEDAPTARFRDPYIESKLRIERSLAQHWRAGFRALVILQPTVVYGLGGSWTDHAFTANHAERVELPGAGDGRCNAVYVDDVCQAVVRALLTEIDAGSTTPPRYLVGGSDVSWREFFEAHGELLASTGGLRSRPSERAQDVGAAPPAVIKGTPTDNLFADDGKKNLAMRVAFSPPVASALFSALALRKPKHPPVALVRDRLAALRPVTGEKVARFDGMGRLYLAAPCRVDSGLAADELGYRPDFDLARGIASMKEYVEAALGAVNSARFRAPSPPGALVDLDRAPPESIRRRLCIVGTGIGGGALASVLLGAGDDVVIVEAGNGFGDKRRVDNVELDNVGLDFQLAIFRDISLGGSGNVWRGLSSPRDPIDFEAREWVPMSGWPIGPEDLTEPERTAAGLLGLDDYDMFADQSTVDPDGEHARQVRFGDDFERKYFLQTRPPKTFRWDLLAACTEPGGPLIVQNAPALELVTDPHGTRVDKLLIKNKSGAEVFVEADVFVIAAGALETPRLLLNSEHGGRPGVGNDNGLVGRYLMDHPMVSLGQVRLRPARTAKLYHALQLDRGRMIKAGIVMSAAAQRTHRLPNHSVFLLPSLHRGFDDNYERARRALITARKQRLGAGDLLTVATNPNVIQWALSYVSALPALFRYADLYFIAEQTPTASSRVDLSDSRDAYGYRKARADWRVSNDDIESMLRFNELLLDAFPDDGYQISHVRERDDVEPALTSAAHFCGTVRMGASPSDSVVDPDLKVWGVDNLYVCDGSVFPTSGNANPGLTIAALGVRLARHLLRGGRGR